MAKLSYPNTAKGAGMKSADAISHATQAVKPIKAMKMVGKSLMISPKQMKRRKILAKALG